jgi:predicted acylesterase/phospholipase RssA
LGTRPKFDMLTGISTGALIAPFAFLGPQYDGVLKEAYTTIATRDFAEINSVPALAGLAPSLSSNDKFRTLISRFLTPEVFAAIAREHDRGRHLLIGTTNLDAQQAVIWDLTEIANSGRPDSLELARNIVMASASIPGVFPPVRIKVTVDGKTYDELHVDGGVTRQVFIFPPGYNVVFMDKTLGWHPHRHAYIIRDG